MALRVKSFRLTDEASEQALNEFLQNKVVRQWSASYTGDPALGHWNVLVAFEDRLNERTKITDNRRNEPRSENMREARPKKEKREPVEAAIDVPAEDMPLYEAVRKWRNTRAKEANVKPFTLFNNKQLESLVKEKPATGEALRALLPNMTEADFDKYNNEILGFIAGSRELASL